MSKVLSPYHASLDFGLGQDILDRIAFIIVRDGLSRRALESYVDVDFNFPYYAQPRLSVPDQFRLTADFLGVSIDWLLTGVGRNTRNVAPAPAFDRCAVVHGSTADSINVYNLMKGE